MIGSVSGPPGLDLEHWKQLGDRDPETLERVAKEFEALLVGQMLKSVRESSAGGWMGSDPQTGSMMELAEQQLARAIASQGGLGLAGIIVKGLSAGSAEQASPKTSDDLPIR